MQTNTIETAALMKGGIAAMQMGDFPLARRQFETIVAAGRGDAPTWLALALACQAMKDDAAMAAALDQTLALEPRNLRAIIMKGDYLLARGDPRAAMSCYGLAVALAPQMKNLPPAVVESVRRAEASRDTINASIEKHLHECLDASGYDPSRSSPRFTQSLEMLSGRKRPYFQQPRAYFFPELPQVQFYPRDMFPWLDAVEAATDDICAELEGVLERDGAFVPYIQPAPGLPTVGTHSLLNKLDWSAFFLCKDGEIIAENAALCPRTMAALADAPLTRIKARSPSILFSLLKPGTHIEPHTGFLNARLICHVPLIVPPGCEFRVGNEVRTWERGKAWVFDDTIEHEAWNPSAETRVVLIFDIWRPELTDEERALVASLLEAVDSYGGKSPPGWNA